MILCSKMIRICFCLYFEIWTLDSSKYHRWDWWTTLKAKLLDLMSKSCQKGKKKSLPHHCELYPMICIIGFSVPGTWLFFKHYCLLHYFLSSVRYLPIYLFSTVTHTSLRLGENFLWLHLLPSPFFVTSTWLKLWSGFF